MGVVGKVWYWCLLFVDEEVVLWVLFGDFVGVFVVFGYYME